MHQQPNPPIMYLYGAGGHAKVILDILESNGINIQGVIDDNPAVQEWMGKPIIRRTAETLSPIIISIGSNEVRKRIAEKLYQENVTFGTAIAPSALLSPYAQVDEGSVVMQGSILQSGCHIGKHCIVNTGASIDHECLIGDYAHISPHATLCGQVSVGEGTWIGAGTTVIPGVKIGKWCIIGAGSVVCKDIPDGVVAYGNPCRVIKKREV